MRKAKAAKETLVSHLNAVEAGVLAQDSLGQRELDQWKERERELRFLRYEETFLLYPRFWWWMGSVTPFFPNVWEHFDVTNSKDQF